MEKFQNLIVLNPILSFISLTFLISLISFSLMLIIPNAQSPESNTGLPVWLIAIWSPNIAAIIIWVTQKKLVINLQLALSFPKLTWWSLLIVIPLLVAIILISYKVLTGTHIEWSNFKISYIAPLILINLLMGPMGEEIGWRAFLYSNFKENYDWLTAAIMVGVIWSLWHAPLWLINSPQSKIPFWTFFINVLCLSVLMSIVYKHSNNSVILIILFHLIFNVSLGIVEILNSHNSSEYFIKSLFIYIPITLIILGIEKLVNR